MKTLDYMVGDWVRPSCWNEQVLLVGEGRITVNSDSYTEDEIKPIPLTAEILELNGWQYGDWENEFESDEYFTNEIIGFDLHINDKKEFEIRCVDAVNITLKFVHELQHALRLCRIDKEIVL